MALTVTGLTDNTCYYLNNPLVVNLTETFSVWTNCSITLEDVVGGKTYNINRYFNQNGELTLDLNEIVKPIFNEPILNLSVASTRSKNVMTFNVHFRSNDNNLTDPPVLFRIGILRGGVYGNEKNVVVNMGVLRHGFEPLKYKMITTPNTLPYWSTVISQLSSDNTFVLSVVKQTDNVSNGTSMPIRNCDGAYLVFLNSKGGVSNWYFDSQTENIKTTSLGYYSDYSKVVDYGSDYERQLTFSSKSNIDLLDLVKDLFVSPYVVIYNLENDTSERIIIDSQNLVVDKSKGTLFFDCKATYITNVNTRTSW